MKRALPVPVQLLLLCPMASAQVADFEQLSPGSYQGWVPATQQFTYELPEPVGPVVLTLAIRQEPLTPDTIMNSDSLRLFAGSIEFRDSVLVELPGYLLECLPHAQPRNVHLSTIFIEPTDSETNWFQEFGSRITIPFGVPVHAANGAPDFPVYPEIEVLIIGDDIDRVTLVAPSGERERLESVGQSCPASIAAWSSVQKEAEEAHQP